MALTCCNVGVRVEECGGEEAEGTVTVTEVAVELENGGAYVYDESVKPIQWIQRYVKAVTKQWMKVLSPTGGLPDGRHLILMDTGAQGSVTNVKELIWDWLKNVRVNIAGWNQAAGGGAGYEVGTNPSLSNELVYAPDGKGTLLAYCCMLECWEPRWARDGTECRVTHRRLRDLTLTFKFLHSGPAHMRRLLVADATEVWHRLISPISMSNVEIGIDLESEPAEKLEIPDRMSAAEYSRAKEVLRFHLLAHPSDKTMVNFTEVAAMSNIPWSKNDVYNAEKLRDGPCNVCAVAKAVKRSKHARTRGKGKSTQSELSDVLVEPVEYLKKQKKILGFDRYFMDGESYLLAVDKEDKFLSSMHMKNGTLSEATKCMGLIYDDYVAQAQEEIQIQNLRDYDGHEDNALITSPNQIVSRATMDGEKALISAAMEVLGSRGAKIAPRAAGDHVGWVERPIRTIKERICAVKLQLPFKSNRVITPWLNVHVVNWLNLLPRGIEKISSFSRHTHSKINYADFTKFLPGQAVVAARAGTKESYSGARGEQGIALGGVILFPGNYYFYSFETGIVKIRRSMEVCDTLDVALVLGANPSPVIPATYGRHVTSYNDGLRAHKAIAGPDGDSVESHAPPPADDVSLKIPSATAPDTEPLPGTLPAVDLASRVAPLAPRASPTAVTITPQKGANTDSGIKSAARNVEKSREQLYDSPSGRSTRDDSPGILSPVAMNPLPLRAAVVPRPKVTPFVPDGPAMTRRQVKDRDAPLVAQDSLRKGATLRVNQVQLNNIKMALPRLNQIGLLPERCLVWCASMSFDKGVKLYAERAEEAIAVEIDQIVNKYEVAHPVHLDYAEVDYMRTHDLINEKLSGEIKARWVCGKFVSEKFGVVDYGIDSFSPTIDMKLFYTMLSLCLERELDLEVWDVKGAFLKAKMLKTGIYARVNPKIAERIFKTKPDWIPFKKPDGSLLLELDKAWYGISAGPSLFNKDIHECLVSAGYIRHEYVKCLYHYTSEEGVTSFIMLHVDDLGVMTPKDGIERNRLLKVLEERYEALKIQKGDRVTYIGIELTRDRARNVFEARVTKRIEKLCKAKGVVSKEKYPYRETVLDRNLESNTWKDTFQYRSLAMSLRYIGQVNKPEILMITSFLACQQGAPTAEDYENELHCLRYLYGVKDEAMVVGPLGPNPIIRVYCDAAEHVHGTGHGQGGTTMFIGDSACTVWWQSGKIRPATRHSTDAETWQLEDATYMGAYVRMFLLGVGVDAPVVYMQDNESCIQLVEKGSEAWDRKRKMMVNCINSVHDYLKEPDERASVEYVITELQHADTMTKPVTGKIFRRHTDVMHGKRDQELVIIRKKKTKGNE